MTPLGAKLRELRKASGVLQRDLAAAIAVSPAYLSALEHGRRGAASAGLIHQICDYFGLIWDDADELKTLARLSRPRLKLNAAGLTPEQTALANRLAGALRHLEPEMVQAMHKLLNDALAAAPEPRRLVTKPTEKSKKKSNQTCRDVDRKRQNNGVEQKANQAL